VGEPGEWRRIWPAARDCLTALSCTVDPTIGRSRDPCEVYRDQGEPLFGLLPWRPVSNSLQPRVSGLKLKYSSSISNPWERICANIVSQNSSASDYLKMRAISHTALAISRCRVSAEETPASSCLTSFDLGKHTFAELRASGCSASVLQQVSSLISRGHVFTRPRTACLSESSASARDRLRRHPQVRVAPVWPPRREADPSGTSGPVQNASCASVARLDFPVPFGLILSGSRFRVAPFHHLHSTLTHQAPIEARFRCELSV